MPSIDRFEGSKIKVIAATKVEENNKQSFSTKNTIELNQKSPQSPHESLMAWKSNPQKQILKLVNLTTNKYLHKILLKTRWAAITKTVPLYPLATTICVKAVIVKALEISSGKEFFDLTDSQDPNQPLVKE